MHPIVIGSFLDRVVASVLAHALADLAVLRLFALLEILVHLLDRLRLGALLQFAHTPTVASHVQNVHDQELDPGGDLVLANDTLELLHLCVELRPLVRLQSLLELLADRAQQRAEALVRVLVVVGDQRFDAEIHDLALQTIVLVERADQLDVAETAFAHQALRVVELFDHLLALLLVLALVDLALFLLQVQVLVLVGLEAGLALLEQQRVELDRLVVLVLRLHRDRAHVLAQLRVLLAERRLVDGLVEDQADHSLQLLAGVDLQAEELVADLLEVLRRQLVQHTASAFDQLIGGLLVRVERRLDALRLPRVLRGAQLHLLRERARDDLARFVLWIHTSHLH